MNLDRIALLEKYTEEEPENPFNWYALAMEYYDYNPQRALEILEMLKKDHPNYVPIYFKLAHLYWEFEKWDEADVIFKDGIQVATSAEDDKAVKELKAAYQNFEFEKED